MERMVPVKAVYLKNKKLSEMSFEDRVAAIGWLCRSEEDEDNFVALAVLNEDGERVWPDAVRATVDYIGKCYGKEHA